MPLYEESEAERGLDAQHKAGRALPGRRGRLLRGLSTRRRDDTVLVPEQ